MPAEFREHTEKVEREAAGVDQTVGVPFRTVGAGAGTERFFGAVINHFSAAFQNVDGFAVALVGVHADRGILFQEPVDHFDRIIFINAEPRGSGAAFKLRDAFLFNAVKIDLHKNTPLEIIINVECGIKFKVESSKCKDMLKLGMQSELLQESIIFLGMQIICREIIIRK